VRARRGVVLGVGGFEWDPGLAQAFLRGPLHGAVSHRTTPATGCAWRWRTAQTWRTWRSVVVPIVRIPGTPSRASSAAAACGLSEPGREASSSTRPGGGSSTRRAITTRWRGFPLPRSPSGYVNDRGWMVFDSVHLQRYGFSVSPWDSRFRIGSASRRTSPNWAPRRASMPAADPHHPGMEPPRRGGSDPTSAAVQRIRRLWGDDTATTIAGKTLGPIDSPLTTGAGMRRRDGHQGWPRTDDDGRVLHVSVSRSGLFAAGNAMAGATGRPTVGWRNDWSGNGLGYRAGHAAATGKSVDLQ